MSYIGQIAYFREGQEGDKVAPLSLDDLGTTEGMLRYICLKAIEERGLPDGNKVLMLGQKMCVDHTTVKREL